MSDATEAPLVITRAHAAPDVVLTLVGELDPHTAPTLQSAVEAALADDETTSLALDMAGLGFVDSSGLRIVIAAQHDAEARGCAFELRSPSSTVQRLLQVTGLTDHITITP